MIETNTLNLLWLLRGEMSTGYDRNKYIKSTVDDERRDAYRIG